MCCFDYCSIKFYWMKHSFKIVIDEDMTFEDPLTQCVDFFASIFFSLCSFLFAFLKRNKSTFSKPFKSITNTTIRDIKSHREDCQKQKKISPKVKKTLNSEFKRENRFCWQSNHLSLYIWFEENSLKVFIRLMCSSFLYILKYVFQI